VSLYLCLQQLNNNLAELTAKFEKATADKLKCQQEAEATTLTINLANRLVGGLASENVRWAEAVAGFKEQVLGENLAFEVVLGIDVALRCCWLASIQRRFGLFNFIVGAQSPA